MRCAVAHARRLPIGSPLSLLDTRAIIVRAVEECKRKRVGVNDGDHTRGSTSSVKRSRHRPEVRQALILEAAKQVIADHGIGRVTAREIAARCGISTGTITHHFPSMDDLLVEALRSGSEEFIDEKVAAAAEQPTARGAIVLLLETSLPDRPEALRNWRLWLEYWARAVHDRDLAAVHTERYRDWRGAFENAIERGTASGEFHSVDVKRAARELVGLFDGLCIEAAIGDEAITVAEVRRIVLGWIDRNLAATPRESRQSAGRQAPTMSGSGG